LPKSGQRDELPLKRLLYEWNGRLKLGFLSKWLHYLEDRTGLLSSNLTENSKVHQDQGINCTWKFLATRYVYYNHTASPKNVMFVINHGGAPKFFT
jgi:hypothetical protein